MAPTKQNPEEPMAMELADSRKRKPAGEIDPVISFQASNKELCLERSRAAAADDDTTVYLLDEASDRQAEKDLKNKLQQEMENNHAPAKRVVDLQKELADKKAAEATQTLMNTSEEWFFKELVRTLGYPSSVLQSKNRHDLYREAIDTIKFLITTARKVAKGLDPKMAQSCDVDTLIDMLRVVARLNSDSSTPVEQC